MKFFKILLCFLLFLGIVGAFSILLRDNNIDFGFFEETINPSEETTNPNENNTETPEDVFDDEIFADSKYLAFGDSITAGGGLESRNFSYPNRAASLLGLELMSNRAVDGSTFVPDPNKEIRHCIANDVVEFASKSSVSYDIISVAGGVNDKALGLPLGEINDFTNETIYGSLNIIVQTIQNKWPDAFFFLITPLKYPRYAETNDLGYVLADVANAIKSIGEKYDVPVLDLYITSGFETASNGMNHPDCDGWHPLQGFVDEYLAPQVADFIRKNYKNQ